MTSEVQVDTGLVCPKCRYNLTAVETNRCPECGIRFAISPGKEELTARQRRYAMFETIAAHVIVGAAVAIIFSVRNSVPPVAGIVAYGVGLPLLVWWFTWPYVRMYRYARTMPPPAFDDVTALPELPVRVHVVYSSELLHQCALRSALPSMRPWITGCLAGTALVGALLLVGGEHWALYVGAGMIAAFLFSIGSHMPGRTSDYQPVASTIEIRADGVNYESNDGNLFRLWKSVTTLDEYPELWVLRFHDGGGLLLPTTLAPEVLALVRVNVRS